MEKVNTSDYQSMSADNSHDKTLLEEDEDDLIKHFQD